MLGILPPCTIRTMASANISGGAERAVATAASISFGRGGSFEWSSAASETEAKTAQNSAECFIRCLDIPTLSHQREGVRIQAGPADQGSIDVWLRHQARYVFGLHAA